MCCHNSSWKDQSRCMRIIVTTAKANALPIDAGNLLNALAAPLNTIPTDSIT
jgi:hypothetical protein